MDESVNADSTVSMKSEGNPIYNTKAVWKKKYGT